MQQYILGIDIGGTTCAGVLGQGRWDDDTTELIVLEKQEFSTQHYETPRQTVDALCDHLQAMLDHHEIAGQEIAAIGISCGGPLDSERGLILSPPNLLGWDEVPIVQWVSQRFGCPAFLENDANASAIAEWKLGAGQGYRDLVFITAGTGFGAGLILNGALYRGAASMAGEIGHIRLSEFGPVGYGKSGSIEGYCSGGGIAQIAQMKVTEQLQQGITPPLLARVGSVSQLTARTVAEAAYDGDLLAQEIYAISGRQLGHALSLLIDLLNPQAIVIGSIFQRSGDLLWPAAQQIIERETLRISRQGCLVLPAALGDRIGDLAALSAAFYHPEIEKNR